MMNDKRIAEMDITEFQKILPPRQSTAITKTSCVLLKVYAQKIWEIFYNIGEDFFQYEKKKAELRQRQIQTYKEINSNYNKNI